MVFPLWPELSLLSVVVTSPHSIEVADLIRTYSDFVFRTLAGLLGRQEAADATQEVFLNCVKHLGHFEGRSSHRTWLYRIARNVAISRLRKQSHQRAAFDVLRNRYRPGTQPSEQPESSLQREELRAAVLAAIEELPLHQREVVVLRGLQGLSFNEVAELLEIPVATAHSRMARAKVRLRERLAEWTDASDRGLSPARGG